jgi:hypothetical protein
MNKQGFVRFIYGCMGSIAGKVESAMPCYMIFSILISKSFEIQTFPLGGYRQCISGLIFTVILNIVFSRGLTWKIS